VVDALCATANVPSANVIPPASRMDFKGVRMSLLLLPIDDAVAV
jgi:hypothetical protein